MTQEEAKRIWERWKPATKRLRIEIDVERLRPEEFALERVPEPPIVYLAYRALVGEAKTESELARAMMKFKEKYGPGAVEEAMDYINRLARVRVKNLERADLAIALGWVLYEGRGRDPLEWKEVHGSYRWLLLVDIDAKLVNGVLRDQNIYVLLSPELYWVSYDNDRDVKKGNIRTRGSLSARRMDVDKDKKTFILEAVDGS